MSEKFQHTILAVDDEPGILKSLKRLLRDLDASFVSAENGEQGLELLKQKHVSLIISDQRMPGMTGVEFLNKSRAYAPDAIRILLTGYADITATIDAINKGAVEYYINKPWDDDLLLSRIRESLNLYGILVENRELQELTRIQNLKLQSMNEELEKQVAEQTSEIREQNEALEQSFMETLKAFSTLIEIRSKEVGSHSQRVASLVQDMLTGMDYKKEDRQNLVVAAFLHDIGKISIPDKILLKSREEYTKADKELFQKHVVFGQSTVFKISGFEEIGLIIRNHHENYDGSGFPDRLSRDQIPFASRLIRVIEAFDFHAFRKGYPNLRIIREAAAHLVRFSGAKYDPLIVKRFIEMDIGKAFLIKDNTEVVEVRPQNLEPGMVVAADIYTHNGMFLLPKGAKLSSGMIKRLSNIDRYDPIAKGILVHLPEKNTREEKTNVKL